MAFEFKTKQNQVGFKDVHPSPTARKTTKVRGKDLPDWQGINGCESRFVRCKQCGFILDKTKTSRGSGYGNETYIAIAGSSTKVAPVIGAGCPFCGASEW